MSFERGAGVISGVDSPPQEWNWDETFRGYFLAHGREGSLLKDWLACAHLKQKAALRLLYGKEYQSMATVFKNWTKSGGRISGEHFGKLLEIAGDRCRRSALEAEQLRLLYEALIKQPTASEVDRYTKRALRLEKPNQQEVASLLAFVRKLYQTASSEAACLAIHCGEVRDEIRILTSDMDSEKLKSEPDPLRIMQVNSRVRELIKVEADLVQTCDCLGVEFRTLKSPLALLQGALLGAISQ